MNVYTVLQHRKKDLDEINKFLNNRLQVWLQILEQPLKSSKSGFYFEDRVTILDTAVTNLLDGLHELFDTRYNDIITKQHPLLEKHYQIMINRDGIKSLLLKQSQAGILWWPTELFSQISENIKNATITYDKPVITEDDLGEPTQNQTYV